MEWPAAMPPRVERHPERRLAGAYPGRGYSSPIIAGEKIFLTTAVPPTAPRCRNHGSRHPVPGRGRRWTEHKFVVLCLNRLTGKVLWERVAVAKPQATIATPFNSPVTDGLHLYAFFGSRGMYSSTSTEAVWERIPAHAHAAGFGEGVAPLSRRLPHLKFDQKKVLIWWRSTSALTRDLACRSRKSPWSPPRLSSQRSQEVVVSAHGTPYDPATGSSFGNASRLQCDSWPVIADGVVYVMSGHRSPNLLAIRL
jgi:hypothetical protein